MKLSLHPGAQDDLDEAAAFYERAGSPAVASKFIAEFKRIASLLREHPDIGLPRSEGRRAFSLGLFPYTVIYRARSDEITVLVVKHDRRRPGYGGKRR